MDRSGMDYLWIIVMFFISCLDSHSDGTHSLQSIHWWASDEMLYFSKSDEETNSSTYLMVHFQQIVIFAWTLHLNPDKDSFAYHNCNVTYRFLRAKDFGSKL